MKLNSLLHSHCLSLFLFSLFISPYFIFILHCYLIELLLSWSMSSRNAANPKEIHVNAVKVRNLVIRIIMYIIYKEFFIFQIYTAFKRVKYSKFHTHKHAHIHTWAGKEEERIIGMVIVNESWSQIT